MAVVLGVSTSTVGACSVSPDICSAQTGLTSRADDKFNCVAWYGENEGETLSGQTPIDKLEGLEGGTNYPSESGISGKTPRENLEGLDGDTQYPSESGISGKLQEKT